VISDWIVGLSMRDYAERHLPAGTAGEGAGECANAQPLISPPPLPVARDRNTQLQKIPIMSRTS
jgi:hypothetical protein